MRCLLVGVLSVYACHSSATRTDLDVYQTLVDSGCLSAAGSSPADVAAEHASPNPIWMQCLYNGGTVQGCAVPCGDR